MPEPVKDRILSLVRPMLSVALGLALCAPLTIAACAFSGIGHRWVDILAQFVGPALVVAGAVLVVAAILKLRLVLMAATVVAVIVLVAGSPQWAPPRGEPGEDRTEITLYSANLHRDNTDVDAIARSIAASDADILVLVEVGPAPTAALDQVLAGYPHRAFRGSAGRPAGGVLTVIASRWPLTNLNLRVSQLSIEAASVRTPLGPVTVAGVHMTRPWPYQIQWEQIRQADGLVGWANATSGPILAAGDFNSVSSARIGRQIRSQSRLIPAPGWPGTWPSALPAFAGITIDQVYRTPDLALVDRRLGHDTGSDHRPVITRFVKAVPPGS